MNTLKSIEIHPEANHSLVRYFAWTVVIAFFIAAAVVGGCFILLDLLVR